MKAITSDWSLRGRSLARLSRSARSESSDNAERWETSTSKPLRAESLIPLGVPTAASRSAASRGVTVPPSSVNVLQKASCEASVGAPVALPPAVGDEDDEPPHAASIPPSTSAPAATAVFFRYMDVLSLGSSVACLRAPHARGTSRQCPWFEDRGRLVQGAGEQLQVLGPRHLADAERGQVRRLPLGVDDPLETVVEDLDQRQQGDLGGVGLVVEHRLP